MSKTQIVNTIDGASWEIPAACSKCGSEYIQIDGDAYCEDCGAIQPMTAAAHA